jgi:hypothetical protein
VKRAPLTLAHHGAGGCQRGDRPAAHLRGRLLGVLLMAVSGCVRVQDMYHQSNGA